VEKAFILLLLNYMQNVLEGYVYVFKQIKQFSDNFSYILADEAVGEAVVVDSSYNVDEIVRVLKAENLRLKYVINTHGHYDHTDGMTSCARRLELKLLPIGFRKYQRWYCPQEEEYV
jgi:glyoxylase-like metal-dependent hydrolase (beta-lactamase superfamily II)